MRKSGNFLQKVCTNPALRNLVRSSFFITFKPLNCNHATLVKKEFLEISRRAIFRKIQTHMSFDRVRERRNFSCYLLNGDSTTDPVLALFKIIGTLIGNIFGGVSFQYSYPKLHA